MLTRRRRRLAAPPGSSRATRSRRRSSTPWPRPARRSPHTTEQLEALARAGVVDAGGQGVVVLLEALAATVSGRRIVRAAARAPPVAPAPPRAAPDRWPPRRRSDRPPRSPSWRSRPSDGRCWPSGSTGIAVVDSPVKAAGVIIATKPADVVSAVEAAARPGWTDCCRSPRESAWRPSSRPQDRGCRSSVPCRTRPRWWAQVRPRSAVAPTPPPTTSIGPRRSWVRSGRWCASRRRRSMR